LDLHNKNYEQNDLVNFCSNVVPLILHLQILGKAYFKKVMYFDILVMEILFFIMSQRQIYLFSINLDFLTSLNYLALFLANMTNEFGNHCVHSDSLSSHTMEVLFIQIIPQQWLHIGTK
jgi:hypothetical protein